MIDEKKLIDTLKQSGMIADNDYGNAMVAMINSQPKIGEWIPCGEKMPENEQDVEITYTRRHFETGEILYLTERAFYEDGTLTTGDSNYCWEEGADWEYCEKTDSYIIPEGWFESVSFTEKFGIVDMPVIAWRPLTEPYREEES